MAMTAMNAPFTLTLIGRHHRSATPLCTWIQGAIFCRRLVLQHGPLTSIIRRECPYLIRPTLSTPVVGMGAGGGHISVR